MPGFKNANNLFSPYLHFEPNQFDSDSIVLPPGGPDDPKYKWDYHRELHIEDVDIWEVLYEASGGIGVYAAWLPYAEFYIVSTGWKFSTHDKIFQTFYGPGAQDKVKILMHQLNIPYDEKQVWKDDDEMWLYQQPEKKIIIV